MRLYLVQHGEAVPEQVDPQRPLSAAGRREVEAIGRLLASAGVRSTRVVHSGKLRAEQTAELLAIACAPPSVVEAAAGLSPNDPVKPVARKIASLSADTMLVGHLPFMARLAGRLVTGASTPRWSPSSLGRCCASNRQPTIAGVSPGWCGPSSRPPRPEHPEPGLEVR